MDESLLCALMFRDASIYSGCCWEESHYGVVCLIRRNSPTGFLALYLYLNHGFLDDSDNMEMGRRPEASGWWLYIVCEMYHRAQ
jgi:hypothetical protein